MSNDSYPDSSYQSFNDTLSDDINSYISALLSLTFNFLLICAIGKIKSYTKSVRFAMKSMAVLRMIFSICIALTCPVILYSKSVTSLYIIKNGINLPSPIGDALLSLVVAFIVMSCNGPAIQYLQVAYLLTSSSKKETYFTISSIPFIVIILSLILIFLGYIPPSYRFHMSSFLVEKLAQHGDTAFLIVTIRFRPDETNESEEFQFLSQICTLFILIIMFISIVSVISCYFFIRKQMSVRFAISSNSRRSQEQLNLVLLLQFLLPFLTIHIPFYIIVILPLFGITARILADQVLFLFCWCPATNPILVIIMVKNIRDQLIPRCCWKWMGGNVTNKTSVQRSRSRVNAVSLM